MPTRTCVTIFARPTASAARACGIAQVVIRGESHPPRRPRWTLRSLRTPRPAEQLPASLGSEPRLAATGDNPPADSWLIPNDPRRAIGSLAAIFLASVTTDCGTDGDSRVKRHSPRTAFRRVRNTSLPLLTTDRATNGPSRRSALQSAVQGRPRSIAAVAIGASTAGVVDAQWSVLCPTRVRGRRSPLETHGRPRLT